MILKKIIEYLKSKIKKTPELTVKKTIELKDRPIIYVAIDPGKSGGIAWSNITGNNIFTAKMPEHEQDKYDFFINRILNPYEDCIIQVWLENVGMHQQGNNASASVTFGKHVGQLEMLLFSIGLIKSKKIINEKNKEEYPVDWTQYKVAAQTWMKPLQPLTKGSESKLKQKRKNEIKEKMQERFPYLKVTLNTADALGILSWAMDKGEAKKKRITKRKSTTRRRTK